MSTSTKSVATLICTNGHVTEVQPWGTKPTVCPFAPCSTRFLTPGEIRAANALARRTIARDCEQAMRDLANWKRPRPAFSSDPEFDALWDADQLRWAPDGAIEFVVVP